ncbi:unnamed protein product, partial [Rotaria socialis]
DLIHLFILKSGQFVTDVDLANMRAQSNRYSQQIQGVQTQMPSDVQKVSR